MCCTNIYSNIIVDQKYIGTSIKVGCATFSQYASSGPKAEGVPTNNQWGRGLHNTYVLDVAKTMAVGCNIENMKTKGFLLLTTRYAMGWMIMMKISMPVITVRKYIPSL